ncbi:hypothetical protein HHI36_013165 [Cryptolaemus montrouzieri]|uniref:Uncharacterized protein n=1 Tax=Cryptolaemus montrouzieri TaxID=559131 RepID=A0ABD2NGL8_9CUCU
MVTLIVVPRVNGSLEFHSHRENANEDVISFANKVENCFMILIGTLDEYLDYQKCTILIEILQSQVSNVSLTNLNRDLAIVLKSRNPTTIEDAFRSALNEEQETKSRFAISKYRDVSNSNSKYCTFCDINVHTLFKSRKRQQNKKYSSNLFTAKYFLLKIPKFH